MSDKNDRRARAIAFAQARGAEVLGEALEDFKDQWVRAVRTVVFEGPADKVFAQIGRSHPAPAQRNKGARHGCQITFVQGPIEVISEDRLLDFGHDHGDFKNDAETA